MPNKKQAATTKQQRPAPAPPPPSLRPAATHRDCLPAALPGWGGALRWAERGSDGEGGAEEEQAGTNSQARAKY